MRRLGFGLQRRDGLLLARRFAGRYGFVADGFVGLVGERLALLQRLGSRWWLGGRLGLLAQPAEQAFLLASFGRRLLIVVGTKHGEDFLKRANAGGHATGQTGLS